MFLKKKMCLIGVALIIVAGCSRVAIEDERQALLKAIEATYAQAEDDFRSCEGSQIELTGLAGGLWQQAEPLLYEAAKHRLRVTPAEAKDILQDVYTVGREVEAIFGASREGTGSAESMIRYARASSLVMRQVKIFLSSPEQQALWRRVKSAQCVVREQAFQFENGKATVVDNLYGEEVHLEARLEPEWCFTYQGLDYAVLTMNLPGSMNSNYLSFYLLRISNGKAEVVLTLGTFALERLEVVGDLLTLYGPKADSPETTAKIINLSQL